MAKTPQAPPLGSVSFWAMAALALDGWLASCQSCVEFWYLQSRQNATVFLDSCASGGLLQKISLLNLLGDFDSGSDHFDQAIYLSATVFRMKNLDAARKRTEGTKVAVYNAYRLYYEVLGANDQAINAAYVQAVQEGKLLRYPEIAKERQDVDFSPVAELRLILDGYRCAIKSEPSEIKMSPSDIEKRATEETVNYVLSFSGKNIKRHRVRDHAEELEAFIFEFLSDQRDLKDFWPSGKEMPAEYRLQLLPVISELVRRRYDARNKNSDSASASGFAARIREEIERAQERGADNAAYVEALSRVKDDLDIHVYDERMLIPTPATDSNRRNVDTRSI